MTAATRSAAFVFSAFGAFACWTGCSSSPGATGPATPETAPQPTPAEPAPTSAPAAEQQGTEAAAPTRANPLLQRLELENGLDVMLLRHEPGLARVAEIGVLLDGGTDHGNPGAADFALHLLLDGADVTAGRLPLRREIERLGGTLTVELGRRTTWICARVPQESWQRGVRALGAAFAAPEPGRSALERAQQELAAARESAITTAPVDFAVQRLLRGDASPSAHLTSLRDRDPAEAKAFLASRFGARNACLALRVPAAIAAQAEAAKKEFGGWNAGAKAEAGAAARTVPEGVAWIVDPSADEDAACDLALVQVLPSPYAAGAAVQAVLANCITVQGIGGRLERLLQESGLGQLDFVPRVEPLDDGYALVLRTTTSTQNAAAVWRAADAARRSLRELAPTLGERTQAIASARLGAQRAENQPGQVLRAMVERTLAAFDDAALDRLAATAELASSYDAAAIDGYLALPFGLVVRGPKPPAELAEARPCELLPSDRRAPPAAAPSDAMIAAAAPWRTRAVEAVGGSDRLARISGFSSTRRISTEGAPDVDENLTWDQDGTFERTRTVLGSTVETRTRDRVTTERVGDKEVQLDVVESAWRRLDAERHPLALLAAWQQERLRFRLLTTRTVGDREHVVLEAVDAGMERLRIELDRDNGLLRAVESWARSPEGTASHTVDRWSDYRTVEGLRVPFRCATQVDDGKALRISTFTRLQPAQRSAEPTPR